MFLLLLHTRAVARMGKAGLDPGAPGTENFFSEKIDVLFKLLENMNIYFTLHTSIAFYFTSISVFLEFDCEIFY